MNNALKELYRIISVIICLTLIASIPTAYAYDKPWENDELLEKQTTLSTLNAVELWEKLAENGKSPAENVVVAVLDYSSSTASAYLHQFTLLKILDCRKEDVNMYQFRVNPKEHPEVFEDVA